MPAEQRTTIHVLPDPAAVAAAAAAAVAEIATAVASSSDRFMMVLSGGQTPRPVYATLAQNYRESLPWPKIHLFWGDDRFVPPDDPSSNYRLVRETLLDHVAIQQINVHPMPVFFQDPAEAAAEYEATMKAYFANASWPRFDLMLLGLGADGHTASLFPHAPALQEQKRWVMAVRNEQVSPPQRLTMTLPVINHAARLHFIVTGADKADVVAKVIDRTAEPASCPAVGVQPENGEVVWWLDEAAASRLQR
jgi:6-phosphogluconolactonase